MPSLFIGVLRRPHGVRGAVKIETYSGESGHFSSLGRVELVGDGTSRELTVESVEVHNGVPVVRFVGIDTPEEIRKLVGWEVRVQREQAAQLRENEYYVTDIVGCSVRSGGSDIGEVVSVAEGGQAPLLEIRTVASFAGTSNTVLVPFMERFVGTVDLEKRYIEIVERWVLDTE